MSIWVLMDSQTVTIATPPKIVRAVNVDGSTSQNNVTQVKITGIGNCTATVQMVGSNDDLTVLIGGAGAWTNIGSATTITGTSADITPGSGSIANTAPWMHYGMTLTAISGLNAAVSARLGA